MSHNWQKTLILENSTIKKALEIINTEALRVAIVIDENNRLKGMISDGDIRRGLLNDLTLQDPVSQVMNSSPITAKLGTSKEALIELMERKQILSVPLLNSDGVLVGLETLHGALQHESYDNHADATMCVREYDYQIPYGVINGEGNRITSMVEKPIQRFFVNAGIYVLSPRVIQSVPVNHKIDMPTLLEQHMKEREKVLMFPIHEYWLDIGRMDDFNRAQADIFSLGI